MFYKINQRIRFLKKSNLKLFILTIIFINTLPIHAYAGPGVAIGAIIVLFTVLFAFFGSLIIRIFNLINGGAFTRSENHSFLRGQNSKMDFKLKKCTRLVF